MSVEHWLSEARHCERCGSRIDPSARDRKSVAAWRKRRYCSRSCASTRDRTCTVEGCARKHEARGYCDMHRQRVDANGSTERRRLSTTERLAANSEQRGDCVVWTGRATPGGYGYVDEWRNNSRVARIYVHRAAVIASGRILQPHDVVMHVCDNPPCINPDHLVVGTQKDNIRDALAKGRLNMSGLSLRQERGAVRSSHD